MQILWREEIVGTKRTLALSAFLGGLCIDYDTICLQILGDVYLPSLADIWLVLMVSHDSLQTASTS